MKQGEAFWAKGLLVVLLAGAAAWALNALGLQLHNVTPEKVRAFVLARDGFAPVLYLCIYGQPLVPLPATVMGAAAGLAFGPLWGTMAALTGAMIRACTQFGVARWVGRETVLKLLKGRALELHQRIGAHRFRTILLIRLIPNVPYDMQNYGLSFSRVPFGPYALATFLGIIPSSFAFAYLGYSVTDPRQLWKFLLAILLIAGMVIAQRAWSRRHPAPAA